MTRKTSLLTLACMATFASNATELSENLTSGKTKLNMNLRYEGVSQDNAKKDASALTLRTRLTYQSKPYQGWSGLVEFEDSRSVLGIANYNNTNGLNTDYSVVADPETTELDQAYIKYQAANFSAKVGRQVITFDNHRFVGHVGWRQDRQTFDGASFDYQASDKISLNYAYINKRYRIFGDSKDIKSQDHLLHASAITDYGKLVGYAYLLSQDNGTTNDIDSYGLRFTGKTKINEVALQYQLEWATQSASTDSADYDADYALLELGATIEGINIKTGWERLGSDNGMYGFSTPLATLHKFNGWTDQFLATPKQGLDDVYISAGSKLFGGQLSTSYHSFNAVDTSDSQDDLGSELDLVFVKPLTKKLKLGVKYGNYFAGDDVFAKVDTKKFWIWLNAGF